MLRNICLLVFLAATSLEPSEEAYGPTPQTVLIHDISGKTCIIPEEDAEGPTLFLIKPVDTSYIFWTLSDTQNLIQKILAMSNPLELEAALHALWAFLRSQGEPYDWSLYKNQEPVEQLFNYFQIQPHSLENLCERWGIARANYPNIPDEATPLACAQWILAQEDYTAIECPHKDILVQNTCSSETHKQLRQSRQNNMHALPFLYLVTNAQQVTTSRSPKGTRNASQSAQPQQKERMQIPEFNMNPQTKEPESLPKAVKAALIALLLAYASNNHAPYSPPTNPPSKPTPKKPTSHEKPSTPRPRTNKAAKKAPSIKTTSRSSTSHSSYSSETTKDHDHRNLEKESATTDTACRNFKYPEADDHFFIIESHDADFPSSYFSYKDWWELEAFLDNASNFVCFSGASDTLSSSPEAIKAIRDLCTRRLTNPYSFPWTQDACDKLFEEPSGEHAWIIQETLREICQDTQTMHTYYKKYKNANPTQVHPRGPNIRELKNTLEELFPQLFLTIDKHPTPLS